MSYVFNDILKERKRQKEKWGVDSNEPMKWMTIITEEVGECCAAILEEDQDNYRDELIQVAATVIAAVEDHDRMKHT
jgi:NTP pyrophosphatase (non-canonical NTP hydrolase)